MPLIIKIILPIWFFFLAMGLNAQYILQKDNKFGLVAVSGKAILETEYDSIAQLITEFGKTPLFLYTKNNKSGIYHAVDSSLTGLVYDEVSLHKYVYYFLRTGNRWGFIAESRNKVFTIVAPQYEELHPLGQGINPFGPTGKEEYLKSKCIQFSSESLYGIISYEDGSIMVPAKYKGSMRLSSFLGEKDHFFIRDGKKGGEGLVIINDSTDVDFRFPFDCKVEIPVQDTLLYAVNKYYGQFVQVWDYYRGKLVVDFPYTCDDKLYGWCNLELRRVTNGLITITVELESKSKPDKPVLHLYTYDLKTGKQVFKDLSGKFSRLSYGWNKEGKKCLYKTDFHEKFKEANVVGLIDEKDENLIHWLEIKK